MNAVSEDQLLLQELRRFGLGFGLLLTTIGTLLLWRGRIWGAGLFLLALGAFLACRYQWPGVLPLFRLWMKWAKFVQRSMTSLLLILLYFLVLTPTALLARLTGRHFVDRSFRTAGKSYWEPSRTGNSIKSAERQF